MRVGANYWDDGRCEFTVWAPQRQQVTLQVWTPEEHFVPMEKDREGYWCAVLMDVPAGSRYQYQLDAELSRPDPASHYQPEGVHQPSVVVNHHLFHWHDSHWNSIPLEDLIIYELHVGTFTPEGTFEAIIDRIPQLLELGINAIELMPVSQFPGSRNWGYDGVYLYGVQASYGGPEGLKYLVDACHQQGMAVIMDVVYNHFGPEGNYTSDFGPYFTGKYNTPWGKAINFDDAHSPAVRNFFIENALYWLREYHIDALRLDAIHAIYDFGARHILAELAHEVESFSQQQGRKFLLIAESDLNDVRVIHPREKGGHSIDAQWSDDLHHSVHTLLTGENNGYYQDFGECYHLEKVLREGFTYSWNYSTDRKRYHGSYAGDCPPSQFVVCSQNHDQVGNRMLGERLTTLVSFEALKLAAATVILSPYIPMLFMGEEYGEEAPFLYFISHTDPGLVEAVRKGRKAEFEAFHAVGEPPDAQSLGTFKQCILNWQKRTQGKHQVLWNLYQKLIQLRRQIPALKQLQREGFVVESIESEKTFIVQRRYQQSHVFYLLNYSDQNAMVETPAVSGTWHKQLDSSETQWMGDGSSLPETLTAPQKLTLSPQSFGLYEKADH